jgi:hypothetical protein
MSTKTTLKHRTESGKIETRKTARDYSHVVVLTYSDEAQAERVRRAEQSVANHTERLAQYETAVANEAWEMKTFRNEEAPVRWIATGDYSGWSIRDDAEIERIAKMLAREIRKAEQHLAHVLCPESRTVVVSWHGSYENATKKMAGRDLAWMTSEGTPRVEAINGGERD